MESVEPLATYAELANALEAVAILLDQRGQKSRRIWEEVDKVDKLAYRYDPKPEGAK